MPTTVPKQATGWQAHPHPLWHCRIERSSLWLIWLRIAVIIFQFPIKPIKWIITLQKKLTHIFLQISKKGKNKFWRRDNTILSKVSPLMSRKMDWTHHNSQNSSHFRTCTISIIVWLRTRSSKCLTLTTTRILILNCQMKKWMTRNVSFKKIKNKG